MQVSGVSFGSLTAVYGPAKKIKNIDKKLSGKVMIKDVTSMYQDAIPSGTLAQAAQNGNKVKLYITGEEREHIEKGHKGWHSISAILDNIYEHFDANKMSISEIEKIVLKRK